MVPSSVVELVFLYRHTQSNVCVCVCKILNIWEEIKKQSQEGRECFQITYEREGQGRIFDFFES